MNLSTLSEHDKNELEMFQEYLSDGMKLSRKELLEKHQVYLNLSDEELQKLLVNEKNDL